MACSRDQDLLKVLHEKEVELKEFQESSRELEEELIQQLTCSENKVKELTSVNQRLQQEKESIQSRLQSISREFQSKVDQLQDQLQQLQVKNETLSSNLRQLEQENDDLERGNRALDTTLQDFQRKFEDLIEQKVFLENELGEKEGLEVQVQRLKDEARDLKQELAIQGHGQGTNGHVSGIPLPKRLTTSKSDLFNSKETPKTWSTKDTPSKTRSTSFQSGIPPPVMSPSTRTSALNIVSDLLKKVGALEYKLASCRTQSSPLTSPVKDNPSLLPRSLNSRNK